MKLSWGFGVQVLCLPFPPALPQFPPASHHVLHLLLLLLLRGDQSRGSTPRWRNHPSLPPQQTEDSGEILFYVCLDQWHFFILNIVTINSALFDRKQLTFNTSVGGRKKSSITVGCNCNCTKFDIFQNVLMSKLVGQLVSGFSDGACHHRPLIWLVIPVRCQVFIHWSVAVA